MRVHREVTHAIQFALFNLQPKVVVNTQIISFIIGMVTHKLVLQKC